MLHNNHRFGDKEMDIDDSEVPLPPLPNILTVQDKSPTPSIPTDTCISPPPTMNGESTVSHYNTYIHSDY